VVDVESKPVLGPDQIEENLLKSAPAVQVIDLDEELGRIGGELNEITEPTDD
jgi:hypothetical protein